MFVRCSRLLKIAALGEMGRSANPSMLLGMLLASLALVSAKVGQSEEPGWATTKPASGPFVEVDGKFMVPYTMVIPGSKVSFEMIPVPGGKCKIGSPVSEEGRNADEGPRFEVEVAPMWVGKTEITWAEYKLYMAMYNLFKRVYSTRKVTAENKVNAVTAPTALYEPSFTYEYGDNPKQPAVTMTQYSAKQYTKWLSLLTGQQYRLPSEAEWEYAARAGSSTAYSFGDDTVELDQYAWFSDNAEKGPGLVGVKKPNPFGLYDMHGNVAEWTVDQYAKDSYQRFEGKTVAAIDAVNWPTVAYPRVVRGGSWESDAAAIRSASRLGSHDEDWKDVDPNIPLSPWWFTSDPARGVGFRVFRSAKPLADDVIRKYWEIDHEDVELDVEARIDEGRGVFGLVDEGLIEEIRKITGE